MNDAGMADKNSFDEWCCGLDVLQKPGVKEDCFYLFSHTI